MTSYSKRNPRELEPFFSLHMLAMTTEGLHSKGDIACELAWRDKRLQEMTDKAVNLERALMKRDKQEDQESD